MMQRRQQILKILYEAWAKGVSSEVGRERLIQQVGIPWEYIKNEITFLKNAGYIHQRDIQKGTQNFVILEISAKGIEMYEKDTSPKSTCILLLAANPILYTNQTIIDGIGYSVEFRTIDKQLRSAEHRDKFELRQHLAVTPDDIADLVLRYKSPIVHFSVHGTRDQIVLEDENGHPQPVSINALKHLFRILKEYVRCIVLNACFTAEQAKAIAEEIDCVIGMSSAITNPAAIKFAGKFYGALGFGESVQMAFELGCNAIEISRLKEEDTPCLLCNIGVDPSNVRFV